MCTIITIIISSDKQDIPFSMSSIPSALDGVVGLDTLEPLAVDDNRLKGKGSRKADLREVLAVASSFSSRASDILCR